jgi:hypothetical protein
LPTVKPHAHWNNSVSAYGICRSNLKISLPLSVRKYIIIRVQSQNISYQLLFRMLKDSRSNLSSSVDFVALGFSQQVASRICLLPSSGWFLAWLIRPWIWRWHFLPKCRSILNGLHGSVSQMIQLFIVFRYKNIFQIVILLHLLFACFFSCLRKL